MKYRSISVCCQYFIPIVQIILTTLTEDLADEQFIFIKGLKQQIICSFVSFRGMLADFVVIVSFLAIYLFVTSDSNCIFAIQTKTE